MHEAVVKDMDMIWPVHCFGHGDEFRVEDFRGFCVVLELGNAGHAAVYIHCPCILFILFVLFLVLAIFIITVLNTAFGLIKVDYFLPLRNGFIF
jgi:hypothetical protein